MTAADHLQASPAISHAYVRKPGPDFGRVGDGSLGIPDPEQALYQHDAFCRALQHCGVQVRGLRHDAAYPDGCFLDDTAVIAGNLAVIGNFAAQSQRQGEEQLAASLLAASRIVKCITAPGTLDASDVAVVGGHYFINLSPRTNPDGAAQLAGYLHEFGHAATVLDIGHGTGLRLGHALCDLGMAADGRPLVMLRADLARQYAFLTFDKILVPWADRGALSGIMINGQLLLPAGHPAVTAALADRGITPIEVQVSEFEKMGAGLRSLALRLPARDRENIIQLTDARTRRVA